MGIYRVNGDISSFHGNTTINLRCPGCRRLGAFHGLPNGIDEQWTVWPDATTLGRRGSIEATHVYSIGYRQCPNTECQAVVFVVRDKSKVVETFPPEVLDFDASNLPTQIRNSLEEAVKCHAAGCYRASALMVRRVLEELCQDKNAQGRTLKDRLAALSSSAVLPAGLLDAADELRLLGNDAAHVEAKDYDNIGKPEVEAAVDLAKELLKSVYQYSDLVAKLRALRKPTSP